MASFADIRPKIAAAITAAITGVQCSGYVLSSPTAPFFDVELDTTGTDYHQSFGHGIVVWTVTVRGCVSGFDQAQQDTLDEWTATSGATSVRTILEADQSLGGVAQAVKVTRVAGYRGVQVVSQGVGPGHGHSNSYLGAEWTVEIYTQG